MSPTQSRPSGTRSTAENHLREEMERQQQEELEQWLGPLEMRNLRQFVADVYPPRNSWEEVGNLYLGAELLDLEPIAPDLAVNGNGKLVIEGERGQPPPDFCDGDTKLYGGADRPDRER